MLVKSPGLTIVAVIALAVAIGGGAAYLEFVNDFFRPRLAFPGSDRLVGLLNYDLVKADIEQRRCSSSPRGKVSSRPSRSLGPPDRSNRT
jgi:hypothetical protein